MCICALIPPHWQINKKSMYYTIPGDHYLKNINYNSETAKLAWCYIDYNIYLHLLI